ncbi:cytochrome c oxidase assembly protein [Brachybacterium sp. MASK1Z-5]|uniref:Cytochrome c oxidase assembly protein n=1 Tax=Brachybacterium halotolerans TaxID=2795215 RepID=A0ABS1BAH7_9MICO|nr:cytochrome c oxidase assembly protein [Brachybacterium halotolerans]
MRTRVVAWIAVAVALVCVPPLIADAALGEQLFTSIHREYPGATTAMVAGLIESAAALAGVLTLGSLVTVAFLHGRTRRTARRVQSAPDLTALLVSSVSWCALSLASIVASAADTNGLALSRVINPDTMLRVYSFGYMPRAWTVTAVAALVVVLTAFLATRWATLLLALWAACIGILAPVVVGQILVGPNHDVGSDAGTLQTLVIGLLLAPLLVDAILGATGAPRTDRGRLRLLARIGVPAALVLEVFLSWFKLQGAGALGTPTAALEGVRILLLLAMGALLLVRGSGTLRGRRVAALGVLLLAVLGAGAAMLRIPPPQYFVPTSIPEVFMGYEVPEAPSAEVLVSTGRLNLLFSVLSLGMIVLYLAMVVSLRRREDRWPLSRTIFWIAGWLVVLLATNSGIGRYSAPDFGVHMAVHMSLGMLAPIFLVQGGIITLILRASAAHARTVGIHAWVTQALNWSVLRTVYHPALVFIVFIGSYYGLYFSPLFGLMMRYHWAHQLMNLHFLLVGYLYYSLIIGVDRPPRPLPHIGRLGYILAAMPFHAFFGVAIISSSTILAETYYTYLDLPWADLAHSQQVAGSVAWAGGEVPLVIAIIALGVQWARQDDVEARRRDRHMDRGLDDEFDAYNEMLKKLSDRKGS